VIKKKVIFFIIIFFITLNLNKSFAKSSNGSGEVILAQNSLQAFYEYNTYKKGTPSFFILHPTGKYFNWTYCLKQHTGNCVTNEYPKQIRACTKWAKENDETGKCFIFAKKRRIVWNNLSNQNYIKVPSKISKEDLIELLLKNNFLTAQVKVQTFDTDNPDLIEKIKGLQKLLDQGALTQADFDKAKKKLLSK